jgi:hypothetical protein
MTKEMSFSLRSLLEKEKLKEDVSNFIDWFCILTIILRRERREYILNTPVPAKPIAGATVENVTVYTKHKEDELDVQSFLVRIMGSKL